MAPQVVGGFAALAAVLVLAGIGAARRRHLRADQGRAAAGGSPSWAWPVLAVFFLPGLAALALLIALSSRTGS